MQTVSHSTFLGHFLARIHRLRRMIEAERQRATSGLRLLRLQRLLLIAQSRLAAIVASTQPQLIPVTLENSGMRAHAANSPYRGLR